MIPKIIHYCWFGGNPLPPDAIKCIESWRKWLPDYEIKQWNETNFDVNAIPYTSQAYAAKKYAFVSDYARFKILYDHGGVYFDTDVEVIKPLDSLLVDGSFMGLELIRGGGTSGINPGLGMALESHLPVVKEILNYYNILDFNNDSGTIVKFTTDVFTRYGFKLVNEKQKVADVVIYPSDFLCPMDSTTGITTVTANTVSIHHYSCSWIDQHSLSFRLHLLKNKLIHIFGPNIIMPLTKFLNKFVKKCN